jgi:hypothetical protein
MNAKFKMPKLRGGSTDFWGASAVLSQALGNLSQAVGIFCVRLAFSRFETLFSYRGTVVS